MAEDAKSTESGTATVDKLYVAYTRSVIRAVSSHEFYRFFLSACGRGSNTFQFTNRYTARPWIPFGWSGWRMPFQPSQP